MPPILYGIKSLHSFVKKAKFSNVYVITSVSLSKKLNWAIREVQIPKSRVLTVPDGEDAKEWKELEKLLKAFRKHDLDRNSLVIALGGGTVGDLVGFAAAIYLRGIRYIQVPTTLLAQVDSAHGGKTGIDFSGYKNQVGSTYEPLAVVLEPHFLKSLSKEQVVGGLGEILKTGFIKDPSILTLLEKERVNTILKSKQLSKIIEKTVRAKRWYVRQDPKETNLRGMLNFGHTIGHAVEKVHHISHGRAVLTGMLEELRITEAMNYTDPSVRRTLIKLLATLGIRIDNSLQVDKKALRADKKISGSILKLPVVERVGKSRIIPMRYDLFIKHI